MGFDLTADALTGFQFTQLWYPRLGRSGRHRRVRQRHHLLDTHRRTSPRERLCGEAGRAGIGVGAAEPHHRGGDLDAGPDRAARTRMDASWTTRRRPRPGERHAGVDRGDRLGATGSAPCSDTPHWPCPPWLPSCSWHGRRPGRSSSITYLPDRWLIANAADALVSTHPVTGPNALRTLTPGAAVLEIGRLPSGHPRPRRMEIHPRPAMTGPSTRRQVGDEVRNLLAVDAGGTRRRERLTSHSPALRAPVLRRASG